MSSRNEKRSVPANRMKALNINSQSNDAEILKKKHIVSPDVSKMKFRYHDPKQKFTVFFETEEKRESYIDRVVNGNAPVVVEPKRGGKRKKKTA